MLKTIKDRKTYPSLRPFLSYFFFVKLPYFFNALLQLSFLFSLCALSSFTLFSNDLSFSGSNNTYLEKTYKILQFVLSNDKFDSCLFIPVTRALFNASFTRSIMKLISNMVSLSLKCVLSDIRKGFQAQHCRILFIDFLTFQHLDHPQKTADRHFVCSFLATLPRLPLLPFYFRKRRRKATQQSRERRKCQSTVF